MTEGTIAWSKVIGDQKPQSYFRLTTTPYGAHLLCAPNGKPIPLIFETTVFQPQQCTDETGNYFAECTFVCATYPFKENPDYPKSNNYLLRAGNENLGDVVTFDDKTFWFVKFNPIDKKWDNFTFPLPVMCLTVRCLLCVGDVLPKPFNDNF